MISKGSVLDYLCQSAAILTSGSVAITLFAGFNILHVPIGVAGQLIYISMDYFKATKAGRQTKQKPLKYWLVAIFLGGVASYLGTGILAAKTGLSEMLIGVALGFFAQSIPEISDIVMDLIKEFIKKKFGSNE